jgi:protein-S-isoprenylcysteine O-methyltransferase Ste14
VTWGERACNWALGLSALSWAAQGLVASPPEERWSVPTLTLAALNGLVGTLFLIRAPLRAAGSAWHLAAAIPNFVLGALAYGLAREQSWPIHAQVLFAVGGLLTLTSLACLGRSFAILPAVRKVVVRGPYRVVRHPAYAGESVMLLAACLAGPTLISVTVAFAALAFLVIRILAEEATLLGDEDYRAYARAHPWRLVPWVW